MSESRRAVRGMLTLGVGQVLNALVGLVMAAWVPRLFGATDYGHWICFRSLIGFLVGFGMLGATDVMTRFYVGFRAAGRTEEAGRVFKGVLLFRCVLACILAVAGYWLLLSSAGAFSRPRAGFFLAASIVFQTIGVTFSLLLYGERRLGWKAAIGVLQTGAVPLAIVLAYRAGALRYVPLACMVGDLVCMVAAMLAARPWRTWPRGWLSRAEIRPVLLFGSLAAFYSLAMNAYINLMPALMGLRGYDVRTIGFVGFALRITLVMHMALAAVGAGLYPSLAALAAAGSLRQAIEWLHVCTRYGVLILLLALGLFILVGEALVSQVVGASFAGTSAMMAVALFSAIPLWMSGQTLRLSLLVGRSRAYGLAGLALVAGFAGPLFLSPVDPTGWRVAWAMCTGCVCAQTVAMLCVRDFGLRGLQPAGLLACLGLLVFPLAVRAGWAGPLGPGIAVVLWVGLFPAVALATRTLRLHELRLAWQALGTRARLPVDVSPLSA